MQYSFLIAALAIGASAAPQLKLKVLNDLVDVDSDNLAGLTALLAGLGVNVNGDVLTPIGPGAGAIPGAKEKRQLKAKVLNDLVDVDSDNLAGLTELLAGLGINVNADVLTPIGPGAGALPGAKRDTEADQA